MEALEGKTLGEVLRAIRVNRELTLFALAQRTGFSTVYHSLLERDKRPGTFEVLSTYKRLGLDATEVRAIKRYCGLPLLRKSCANGGCDHDGQMLPGAGINGRDESCVHCTSCLDVFLTQWIDTDESHCPASCSKRTVAPWHVRYNMDQGYRESGSVLCD